MIEHCDKHPQYVGECRDCYRAWYYHLKPAQPKTTARARKTDPDESHEGVYRIAKGLTRNRALILRLDFPPGGMNYRQIAEASGIYPTTCSRVITSMVREGSLVISKTDGRISYYEKAEGL